MPRVAVRRAHVASPAARHTPTRTRRSRRSTEAARSEPQRAFVSASLRPYLLASLLDSDPDRPALVVAGDDRAARDLAADLKAFLAPRPVRLYPARGVRYESHLAPPPHLVGLRIAALDALAGRGGGGGGRVRHRAQREGARPGAAPARLRDREGRAARPGGGDGPARGLRLRARRPGRGPRPVRAARRHPRRLPGHRGARGALRAVRHRGRAAHLLLHLHAALARGGGASRDRARRRARPRAPRARRDGGAPSPRRTGPTSRSCCRSTASARCCR